MENSLLELKLKVSIKDLNKVLIFISSFDNISWFKKEKNWEISIFCNQKKNFRELQKKIKEYLQN